MKIGFIGLGNMASAIIAGILKKELVTAEHIMGSDKLPEAREKAKEVLTSVGLENDINTYPDELSGGMTMRVAIARALAYDGDLLLLDEAFNGIDSDTAEGIMDIIKDYAKDRPVLVITHIKEHLDYLGCKCIEL